MTEPTITDERQLTPEMRSELTQAVTKILAEMTPDERYAAVAEAAGAIKRERDEALAVLRDVEWAAQDGEACPICQRVRPGLGPQHREGHGPDCRLAAALRGSP